MSKISLQIFKRNPAGHNDIYVYMNIQLHDISVVAQTIFVSC